MNNVIDLNKALDCKNVLAFEEYGYKVFSTYVKPHIDYKGVTTVKFPKHIDKISVSFVKGFSKEILAHIPLDLFLNRIRIEGSKELIHKFEKGIKY